MIRCLRQNDQDRFGSALSRGAIRCPPGSRLHSPFGSFREWRAPDQGCSESTLWRCDSRPSSQAGRRLPASCCRTRPRDLADRDRRQTSARSAILGPALPRGSHVRDSARNQLSNEVRDFLFHGALQYRRAGRIKSPFADAFRPEAIADGRLPCVTPQPTSYPSSPSVRR